MSNFEAGLAELAPGTWAYMQPDGSWGLNNAGLITDGEASLLVDTLFDLAHTDRMLRVMRDAVPASKTIGTVVNTHANGDHCWGNQLVRDAQIVASSTALQEMIDLPPKKVALLRKAAAFVDAMGPLGSALATMFAAVGLTKVQDLKDARPFVEHAFGRFEFEGIELVPPSKTFEGELQLKVGDREVQLIELGPAHTEGDIIAWVPDKKTVYTGDLLFMEAHPIVWAGPVDNWVAALDRITALEPAHVVPGHGRLTDLSGVETQRRYLRACLEETTRRYEAGLSVWDATVDLAATGLDEFGDWPERERLAVNVDTIYRELDEKAGKRVKMPDPVDLFARMARLSTV